MKGVHVDLIGVEQTNGDDLIANQELVTVDSTQVKTLAELWPEAPRAMVIGLNPAPRSVDAGHYYQGAYGQRQMYRLAQAGLFELDEVDAFVDDAAVAFGVGFADLVRRPTPGEGDVSTQEILEGAQRIKTELLKRRVPLVISVFRHPAQYLSGLPKRHVKPGFLALTDVPGTKLFRMPGPTAASASADQAMAQLRAYLQEQRQVE